MPSNLQNFSETEYRRDIDGLRTIAVISVILYHYFPNFLPGGFVGVDVFFVISGFLISGILYRELSGGRFSFTEFYARRICRIFPALLIVLVFVWISGWLFLLPHEFIKIGKHVSAGVGFYSNFQLLGEGSYFDRASDLKPLLHLWSLGIEEQFYIIWPLLLFVAWRFFAHKSRYFFLGLIILIAVVSFGHYFHYWTIIKRKNAFYLPQSRFWELMIGSIAAYLYFLNIKIKQRYSGLASIFGLLLIAISLTHARPIFMGWWPLLTCVGTFLLLHSPESWIAKNILSRKIMVFLGLISYPLYLWHWPLLTYTRIVHGMPPDMPTKVILIAINFILGFLTYRYLEIPIRFSKKSLAIKSLCLLAAMASLLLISIPTSRSQISSRFTNSFTLDILAAKKDLDYPGFGLSGENLKTNTLKGQILQKVFVMGDSHADHYWPRFKKLYERKTLPYLSTVFATYKGCLPIPDDRGRISWNGTDCDKVFRIAFKMAMQPDVKRVVFSAFWSNLSQKEWKGQLDDFEKKVKEVISAGKECVIILPNPTGPEYEDYSFIKRYQVLKNYEMPPLPRSVFESKVRVVSISKKLREIGRNTEARILDPVDWLCSATECHTMLNGKVIYKDDNHLRASFVAAHAEFLDSLVED